MLSRPIEWLLLVFSAWLTTQFSGQALNSTIVLQIPKAPMFPSLKAQVRGFHREGDHYLCSHSTLPATIMMLAAKRDSAQKLTCLQPVNAFRFLFQIDDGGETFCRLNKCTKKGDDILQQTSPVCEALHSPNVIACIKLLPSS